MAKRKQKSSRTGSKRNPIFETLNENAAGIDAGADDHWVAVPEGRLSESVRKFPTTTRGLYELADWLVAAGVETVAIEATGVYCVPLLDVLEDRGIEVLLAKPSSLKFVNDRRKTDLQDCQWIQYLHTLGLLRPSYRPTQLVGTFRSYVRQRRMLIEQASTSIEHMKKALIQMNVRIDQAVTDVTGQTGMAIIRAILGGQRDPVALARLRHERCNKSEEQIAEALFGKWADEHLFALRQAVATWDHYQALIAQCNQQVETYAHVFDKKVTRETIPPQRRKEHVRKNVFPFEARELFYEILGVDLTQIDGISVGTIAVFLSEVGTSVDAFASEKKFTSWLRLSPGSKITGGKNRSGKNFPTTNRLATALRLAAQALEKSDSALGAFHRRMKARLGPQKAITATAHKLARMIYFTIKLQRPYTDPGANYWDEKNRERVIKRMQKRAKQLGYDLVKAA